MMLERDKVLEVGMMLEVDRVFTLLLAGNLLAIWWIGDRGAGVGLPREELDILRMFLTLKRFNNSLIKFQYILVRS